ncbi:MAG: serine/threonine phosphatase [Cyanobacteria bacterium P01_A01_bin.114]
MVVCSQCQFENPSTHKFCQQCGTSLKVLRALLTYASTEAVQPDADDGLSAEGAVPDKSLPDRLRELLSRSQGSCLDAEGRYQLLTEFTLSPQRAEADVLDIQPERPGRCSLPNAARPNAALPDDTLPDAARPDAADHKLPEMTPAEAYPYLLLQERFFPSVPELRDAWIEADYSVILIEDRSELPQLLDVWATLALAPLQQLHCFYVMTELWETLIPFNGQSSLLKLDNLCIDEDQIFCLRRIEIAPHETAHTLQDMGLLWQSLLQSNDAPLETLVLLASLVTAGEIDTVEALKTELLTLADKLQADESDSLPLEDFVEDFEPPALGAEASVLEAFKAADMVQDEGESSDSPTMALPMKLIGLEEVGQTHVGQQREHNEDAYFIQSNIAKQEGLDSQILEARCLYILCDGMGGHAGGEVASRLAVQTLKDYFDQHWQTDLPSDDQIWEAISLANQKIYEINEAEVRSGSARMGTTLVMLLVNNTQAVAAHVGDSRLYRSTRRLGLQQMTTDHEVGQREIHRGIDPATAYARPDAYQLTQALGPRDQTEIHPSITHLEFNEDTLLLLCSDGLSDRDLLEDHQSSHINPVLRGGSSVENGVAALIELANEINGHDNITAIAVKLKVKPNLDKLQLQKSESDL